MDKHVFLSLQVYTFFSAMDLRKNAAHALQLITPKFRKYEGSSQTTQVLRTILDGMLID